MLTGEVDRAQIHIGDAVPVLGGDLERGFAELKPGGGDEDVEAAKGFQGAVDGVAGSVEIGDIGFDGEGADAVGFDGRAGFVQVVERAAGYGDIGAGLRERDGHGAAEAAAAAGNERGLP